jgi:phosphatidylserine/phosphatidylglycerophosphate/cardiolipin synthase-like enzyme
MAEKLSNNEELYIQKSIYMGDSGLHGLQSAPWYIRGKNPVYQRRDGGHFKPLICGEEAFRALESAISSAKSSIDIISWGFDPAMKLRGNYGVGDDAYR